MKKKENRIISYVFLVIIFALFAGIILRIFTRTVLVSRLKMNNAFTNAVFFDSKGLLATENVSEVEIDWASIYPFKDSDTVSTSASMAATQGLYGRISDIMTGKMSTLKTKINDFTTAYLPGYDSFVYLSNKYKNAIGWNFASYSEYNGILELNDGYLSSITEKRNVNNAAQEVISLSNACEEMGVEFTYVLAPEKLCTVEDTDYSGSVDYSNQNADEFLLLLASEGIECLDLRENIHAQGLNHHSMYFRTDHHWIPETGLWAACEILFNVSDCYGLKTCTEMLNNEYFTGTTYEKWFLGSQGKKVTLANTEPDDIVLLMPDFETSLVIDIPSVNVHREGDFSVTYDMEQISVKDYNKKSPYHAYCYGDRALISIENRNADNNTKLLIVRDSFGDVVVPFAALGVSELTAVDLRYFTGSLVSLIESIEPDEVIVLYGISDITEPEYDTHRSLWDLR